MIRVSIQIEDGVAYDSCSKYGFIYKKSDRRFAPPEKKCDTSSYAEEAGEHIDNRTVYDAFDYSVEFIIECPNKNLVNANSKIAAFNAAIRESKESSDVKTLKEITLYDYYKRCKIVGYPNLISTVDESSYFRRADGSAMDCVIIKLTIRVCDPNKCDFNLSLEES